MDRLHFSKLPLAARVAIGVAWFDLWVSTEEFVINRSSLPEYMPFYRTASGCLWDLAVVTIIVFLIWRASRSPGRTPPG